jgi:myosin heavy subunit
LLFVATIGSTASIANIQLSSCSGESFAILGGSKRCAATANILVDQFREVESSMRTLGYSEDKIASSWSVIAAILELGNVHFVDVDTSEGKSANVSNPAHCTIAAQLLGVGVEALVAVLTKRTMKTAGEVYTISLNAQDATQAKNALCKALYANMFSEIVASINLSLGQNGAAVAGRNSIGVLDIFGFESFQRNELQQLLINYA